MLLALCCCFAIQHPCLTRYTIARQNKQILFVYLSMAQAEKQITSPRRRGRPRKHTREQLVDIAVELLDEQGFGALTLHGLARRAGVIAPTLYNSFESIDDLHSAVLDRIALYRRIDTNQPLRPQLVEYFLAIRAALIRHPHVQHPAIGTEGWVKLMTSINGILEALAPLPQPAESLVRGYYALIGLMTLSADRARAYGDAPQGKTYREGIEALPPESSAKLRELGSFFDPKVDREAELTNWLNELIDRLFPGLDELVPPTSGGPTGTDVTPNRKSQAPDLGGVEDV